MDNEFGMHDDEIEDIIEKPVSRVKSVEELRSHTLDDDLNDLNKSIFLLKSSYEVQVIVGIKTIPFLLKTDKTNCIHKVFPQFKDSCFLDDLNRSLEFYETLNGSLLEILSSQLLTPKEFIYHFIDLINDKIYYLCEKPSDYETSAIYNLWTELVYGIVDLLPEPLVKTAIFDLISNIKLHNSSKMTREYLTVLLAKCAPKLNPNTVKNQLYPILLDLCNDTQYEVRASGCKSLSVVCKSLGADMTSSAVIPEMFKYLCDESTLVKTACFQSLVEILCIFTDYETKTYLLKKIQSIIEYGLSIKDELYLLKITENLGKIITYLNDIMTSQAKLFFIDVFCQICKNENLFTKRSTNESKYNWLVCKVNLANCFPEILLITNSTNFESKLNNCLSSLIKDKNEKVRVAIVSKIIEIARQLGHLQHHLLINDFCACLTDESPLVLSTVTSKIESFLNLFVKKDSNGILNESQQMPGHQLVLKRLLQLEQTTSQTYKYSIHVQILESFALLPKLFCTDLLVDKVLPVLDVRLNSRALPVRLTSVKSILIILRKIPRSNVRFYYFNRLIEFSVDKNCYKRIMFVDICRLIMQLYSKNFFKSYFYQPIIKLAHDPVVNVRISFIKILADLKKIWRLQNDREKLENLEMIARNFFHDRDKDVFELAQKAIIQMDQIKTYINNESENKLNRIKEEEENYLIELEPKKPKNMVQNANATTINPKLEAAATGNKKDLARSPAKIVKSTNSISNASNNNSNNTSSNSSLVNGTSIKANHNQFLTQSQPILQQQHNYADLSNNTNNRFNQNHVDSDIKKRVQQQSLSSGSERPKAKPLQVRRSSINSDMFTGTNTNSINSTMRQISKKK